MIFFMNLKFMLFIFYGFFLFLEYNVHLANFSIMWLL